MGNGKKNIANPVKDAAWTLEVWILMHAFVGVFTSWKLSAPGLPGLYLYPSLRRVIASSGWLIEIPRMFFYPPEIG